MVNIYKFTEMEYQIVNLSWIIVSNQGRHVLVLDMKVKNVSPSTKQSHMASKTSITWPLFIGIKNKMSLKLI